MEFYYRTYDHDDLSKIENDSIMTGCAPSEDDPSIVGCTFELGYVEDHEERGLSQAHQNLAGWVNAVGDYGIRYKTR